MKEQTMFFHPDLMLDQAHRRHRELIAEADTQRLLRIARQARRATRHTAAGRDVTSQFRPAARGRPEGSLAACE